MARSNTLSIEFDAEKTRALRQFMDKKELTIEAEMIDFFDKLYEKYVPPQVREFIEMTEESGSKTNPKILQDKGFVSRSRHKAKETPDWQSQPDKTE